MRAVTVSKTKGFTLIELLVVVSIISLLSSIVVNSLTSGRIKARDTRRLEDLYQIRTALQMYFIDYGSYPDSNGWSVSNAASWTTLQTTLSPYIKTLPKDPVNTASGGPWTTGVYVYAYGKNNSSYSGKYDLIAQLEDVSSPYRCYVKDWRWHTEGNEASWCDNPSPNQYNPQHYSPYLYADH